MHIFSSTRNKFAAVAVTAIALVAVSLTGVLAANFGPARPTFTWASPATYITFNSITDNPQYGDERKFLAIRDISNPQYSKSVDVQDNQELYVQVFYHNNAAANLNLTATNTRVRIALPHTPSTSTYINGHISASNATPGDVQDSVDLTGSRPFTIEYEPGSAQVWNNVFRGATLSDEIVSSSGALIGYSVMNGNLPGCAQYSGYVTMRVRVHMPSPTPVPTPTPTPIPTPTPVPTPTPTKTVVPVVSTGKSLPNTGPGDVIGIFSGVGAAGGIGHYLVTRRRK